jgi:hypothetical protein
VARDGLSKLNDKFCPRLCRGAEWWVSRSSRYRGGSCARGQQGQRRTASTLVIMERSLAHARWTTIPPVASTWQRLLQLSAAGYDAL